MLYHVIPNDNSVPQYAKEPDICPVCSSRSLVQF